MSRRRTTIARACLILAALAAEAQHAAANEAAVSPVRFNSAFLRGGSAANVDLSIFTKEGNVPPGRYEVDLYINGSFLKNVELAFVLAGDRVRACLNRELIVDANVLEDAIATPWQDQSCRSVEDAVRGATESFDSSRMRLDLVFPQVSLRRTPRGFVPESAWDSGETAGFVNYSGSYYNNSYRGANRSLNSTYFNLQNGLNLGLWQLRNSSTLRHTPAGGTAFTYGNTFLRRALPAWRSELTLGETSTSGTLFDALSFRGVRLASDERMLSPNRQGYAPVVRGMAYSNARVVIRQASTIVYESSVPPGEFAFDDLYPTQNSGDLTVEVTEADGSVRSFVVPFSAVAASLRPGLSRYAVTAGRTKVAYSGVENVGFAEATYERGISNRLTLNGGAQLAGNNYAAMAAGAVLATDLGAFGVGASFAHAGVRDAPSNGWQFKSSYNTAFAATGTSLTLAGYRHSTSGYRSLADTLGGGAAPYYIDDQGNRVRSNTFKQRNRFDLLVSQPLGRSGSVFASAIRQDYYDHYRPGTQFQLGYQNTLGRVGYSVSLSRQSQAAIYGRPQAQNVAMLSISVPLDLGRRSASLTSSVSRYGDQGTVVQSNLTGTAGAHNEYSYGANVSRDSGQRVTRAGVNLGRNTSMGAFGAGYSHGTDSSAFSAYARGAVVAHRGGVLLGPYVGDTFGIVEAEGAGGAKLTNAAGVVLNRAGFGIIPALAPYRYNTVSLDPAGAPDNVELEETQKRVAPYAGAIARIQFKTRTGYPVLVDVELEDGKRLPVGAPVSDAQGHEVGVVGQGGHLYARVKAATGVLFVALGPGGAKCEAAYDIAGQDLGQALIRTRAVCRPVAPSAQAARPIETAL
ncbi:outer membrane usher protein [Variovorax sp. HW608]|uniref:fimbria/pilus outer membrane usher protein n=1 Tax=Variovorax sp. HW608 TaxID=1034889 RepID=UPI00081FB5A9|nr:fimbria/pilus outer membrane usher protein [Variovorax sp. HW608]SCK56506.1 outer membrane usher protein [Variovorax sp. HW608]